MKITVDVTNPELDSLEDVLTAWNLCPRHVEKSATAGQKVRLGWQYTCGDCKRTLDARIDKSLHLWSKLCRAYDSPRRSPGGKVTSRQPSSRG